MALMEHAYVVQKTKAEPTSVSKKGASPQRAHSTGSLTRIPQWANFAYRNQVPSSLRPPTVQLTTLEGANSETISITGDNFRIGSQLALEAAPREMGSLQARSESTQNKENNTGMPDTLKARIEALSGISMDDVQVHYNSSKPAQVQALAYTHGTDIHVGGGQERHLPHEVWHVVQQMQGRVVPTMQAKGVDINDDQDLEREADRMGAVALAWALSPQSRSTDAANTNSDSQRQFPTAVQRKVNSFKATTEVYIPPNTDLGAELDYDKFANPNSNIDQVLRELVPWILGGSIPKTKREVPTDIIANLERSNPKVNTSLPRKGNAQQIVGQIGRIEFYLRTGIRQESYEGGHLIGQQFWSEQDPDKGKAGDYSNLVPMPRTMNVIQWEQNVEKPIADHLKSLMKGHSLDVTISIPHEPYTLSYAQIAQRLGLTLNPKADGNETVTLYGWIPNEPIEGLRIHMTPKGDPGSDYEMEETIDYNPTRQFTFITTKAELLEVLAPFRSRIDDGLWKQLVNKIK